MRIDRAQVATATELREAYELRGIPLSSPDRAVLAGCTVVGGYGTDLGAGAVCCLATSEDRIRLFTPDLRRHWSVEMADVVALHVGGPGAVTKGGGFIGGGFGVQGAAEGMIVAAVLNGLTTKTTVNSLVRVTGRSAEVIVHTSALTPEQLELKLSPVLGRLRSRSGQPAVNGAPDLADQLTKLAALHDAGVLSAEEFASAKAKRLA
jgi:hypothetical protein